MIWIRQNIRRVYKYAVILVAIIGYFLYTSLTGVPYEYEYYDRETMPYECDIDEYIVIDEYFRYLDYTTACGIEDTLNQTYFDDGYVVFVEQYTIKRPFKTPRVNDKLFGDGTLITIRLGEKRSFSGETGYRLYVFEFQKDEVDDSDFSIRVTRDND